MRRTSATVMFGLLAAALVASAGCDSSPTSPTNSVVPGVTAVSYRVTSGAIPPDLAWEETYIVSSTGLTFVRTGFSASSTVNAGTWAINGYGSSEMKLFSDLSGAAVFAVVKTGQGTAPIGGGIKDYTIRYDNGVSKDVIIGDGSIYNHAELITTPVDRYVAGVTLPAGVANRYR